MNLTSELHQNTGHLNSACNPIWMDGLRILLGIFLFIKGINFLEHCSDVFYIFSANQEVLLLKNATLITSTVHIIGGLMIALGCLTRFWLLCQLPILVVAVLVVNLQGGIHVENTELWLSLLIIALLIFLVIVGPGRYSVDNKFLRPKRSKSTL